MSGAVSEEQLNATGRVAEHVKLAVAVKVTWNVTQQTERERLHGDLPGGERAISIAPVNRHSCCLFAGRCGGHQKVHFAVKVEVTYDWRVIR